jgi:hypothetical protein
MKQRLKITESGAFGEIGRATIVLRIPWDHDAVGAPHFPDRQLSFCSNAEYPLDPTAHCDPGWSRVSS